MSTQVTPRGTSEGGTSQLIDPADTVLPYGTSSPSDLGKLDPGSTSAGCPATSLNVSSTDSTVQAAPPAMISQETLPLGAWKAFAGSFAASGTSVADGPVTTSASSAGREA
jgi:hypothetical protein